jgi:chromate transport protein ChrA
MDWLWSPIGIGVLWLVLHPADYLLTIATVRLRARGNLAERVQSGGSLELNPLFVQVVEKGQWFSRRFLLTLVFGAIAFPGAVAYVEWSAEEPRGLNVSVLSEFICGALAMTRFAVISIHLQNLALFRRMLHVPEAAIVSLRYDRGTVMAVSRARKLEVACFCAIAVLVSGRPFFMGGLAATLALVAALYRWERRQVPTPPAP